MFLKHAIHGVKRLSKREMIHKIVNGKNANMVNHNVAIQKCLLERNKLKSIINPWTGDTTDVTPDVTTDVAHGDATDEFKFEKSVYKFDKRK